MLSLDTKKKTDSFFFILYLGGTSDAMQAMPMGETHAEEKE